jgi:DNA repair exonuclease SbcCD nuclease subunit
MARPLREVELLSQQCDDAPVLCAGDIFHRWNSPPELINFAMEHLPRNFYAVPGQHDLPNHSYDLIKKSAFWTLVRAGKIHELNKIGYRIGNMIVYGFGWGCSIEPPSRKDEKALSVAVVHQYIWNNVTNSYPGAPEEGRISAVRKAIGAYDAAAFGDNHKGFLSYQKIMNCGGLMRRASDEKDYKPAVGLLYSTGLIERVFLNTDEDWFEPTEQRTPNSMDLSAFVDELGRLGADPLDFEEMLLRAAAGESEPVQKFIQEAIDESV